MFPSLKILIIYFIYISSHRDLFTTFFVISIPTILGAGLLAGLDVYESGSFALTGDVFHVMHQVANRVPGVPVGIGKTNQIR